MSEVTTYLEAKKEEISLNLRKVRSKALGRIFKELFENPGAPITNEQIGDLIAFLCKEPKYAVFFMNEVYQKIRGYINLDLERYILEKYCLYDKETLSEPFVCRIQDTGPNKYQLHGHTYLTEFRLISLGPAKRPGMGYTMWAFSASKACNITIPQVLKMRGLGDVNPKPLFGYHCPIVGAQILSVSKNKLKFQVEYEYEFTKKNKTRIESKSLVLTVLIKKAAKGESKADFKERIPRNITALEEVLERARTFL